MDILKNSYSKSNQMNFPTHWPINCKNVRVWLAKAKTKTNTYPYLYEYNYSKHSITERYLTGKYSVYKSYSFNLWTRCIFFSKITPLGNSNTPLPIDLQAGKRGDIVLFVGPHVLVPKPCNVCFFPNLSMNGVLKKWPVVVLFSPVFL